MARVLAHAWPLQRAPPPLLPLLLMIATTIIWLPLAEAQTGTTALYVGGTFNGAGDTVLNHIGVVVESASGAASGVSPLSTGCDDEVDALAWFNGSMVAAGRFWVAGGQIANHVAAWNGTAWTRLGSGINTVGTELYYATALAVYGGDSALVMGGWFLSVGGVNASNVASWSGTAWSPLGTGTNGAGGAGN